MSLAVCGGVFLTVLVATKNKKRVNVSPASMGKSPSFASTIFAISGGKISDRCESLLLMTGPCVVGISTNQISVHKLEICL